MRKVLLLVLLLAVVLVASALPVAMADQTQRVMIEFAPGRGTGARNAILAEGGEIHFRFNSINTIAATVPEGGLRALAGNPRVVSIEEDPLRYLAAETMPYGIERVQAPEAWAAGADGEGVNVCIIDTGFGIHHEDLQGLVYGGTSQVDDNWARDGYGHGTHVAGTITAVGNNNLGVIGVSPGLVDLYIVKIFDDAGEWVTKTHASNLIAAALTCGDNGAQIISMSLSGTTRNRAEERAFDTLYAQGVLSVAAASNEGIEEYHYPASYDSVISVAATDINNDYADFSQFNDQVELAAPGVGVLSTVPFVPTTHLYVGDEDLIGQPMEFSPYGEVTGTLVDGGLCLATDPAADWTGNVVLCERGEVSFAEKVTKVMDNGGAAAVVYNNAEGLFSGTLGDEGDWIVAISLSQADGLTALNYLDETVNVVSAPPELGSGYEAWNGTSMSTPHVSGVAALLWSACPDCTNVQIREAMDATALDLGDPGRDVHYGFGLVQAYDALQYLLSPPYGPPGEPPYGPPTGRG